MFHNIFKKPIRSTCEWGHGEMREKLGVASFVFSYKVANWEMLSVHVRTDMKIWEPKIPEKARFSSCHFEDFTEILMGFDTKLKLKSNAVPSSECEPTRWLTGTFIFLAFQQLTMSKHICSVLVNISQHEPAELHNDSCQMMTWYSIWFEGVD